MVGVAHGEQVLQFILRLTVIGQRPAATQLILLRIQIPNQIPIPYVEIICLLMYELVV